MNLRLRKLGLFVRIASVAARLPGRVKRAELQDMLRSYTPDARFQSLQGWSAEDILKLVRLYLIRPIRMRGRRCIRRGLVGFYFLRLAGIAAELRFGVFTNTTPGSRYQAHCWIVLPDGREEDPPVDPCRVILTWPS